MQQMVSLILVLFSCSAGIFCQLCTVRKRFCDFHSSKADWKWFDSYVTTQINAEVSVVEIDHIVFHTCRLNLEPPESYKF